MDDSMLCDIYEDLSVDKWTKGGLADRDSSIDLFTEALAVDTIDKVASELAELRRENEKLRQENAELREGKKQLSKNISSLFLTARREILEKEQQIAKLMLEKRQENNEASRPISDKPVETLRKAEKPVETLRKAEKPVETLRKAEKPVETLRKAEKPVETLRKAEKPVETLRTAEKPDTIQLEDKHLSSYRDRSNTYLGERSRERSRDRLNNSQLYSQSSSQDLASRKRHRSDKYDDQSSRNRSSNSSHSETRKTIPDKWRPHGGGGRDVGERKHSSYHRTHEHRTRCSTSSHDRHSHKSNVDRETSRRESKSGAHADNNTKMADSEHQNYAKIRKLEIPQTGVVIDSRIEKSGPGSGKHTRIVSSGKPDTSISKSETVSIRPELIAHSGSQFTSNLVDPASKSTKLKCVLEPEKKVVKIAGSLNHISKNSSANFNNKEHYDNVCAQSSVEGAKISGNVQVLNLAPNNKSDSGVKSAMCSVDVVTAKDDVSSPICANSKQKTDINHLEQDSSHLPFKSPYEMESVVNPTESNISNVKDLSHLSERSLGITKSHTHALAIEKDTKKHSRHRSSSRESKKLCDKASTSPESDRNNSSSSSCQEKPSKNDECKAISENNNVNCVPHVTYITCTSNLILLGDEDSTCTTLASPSKFQPSEFYPPGVRGDVREGGSHVRHIRGLTEVIPKPSTEMNYSFDNEQINASEARSSVVDQTIQVKNTLSDCTNTSDMTFESNSKKTSPRKSQFPLDTSSVKEHSDARPDTRDNLSVSSSKGRDWVSTVREMFGDVFKKNLHAWKRESEYPTKPEVGDMKS